MLKRILVPIDPARPFAAAQKYAVDLAHAFGSALATTYIIDEGLLGHVGGEAAQTLDDALEWVGRDAMDDFAAHHTDIEITKSLAYGHTATALFQMVLQTGATDVVLGGYHKSSAHLWGSTCADIVHHVERPTFVVRRDAQLPTAGQWILVPYDGTQRPLTTLPKICDFAKHLGANIELLYVTRKKESENGEMALQRGASVVEECGLECRKTILRRPLWKSKGKAIIDHAHGVSAPLIALSRLGKTSIATGRSHTVEYLVGHSDVPVWVVRK